MFGQPPFQWREAVKRGILAQMLAQGQPIIIQPRDSDRRWGQTFVMGKLVI
jgi:hypothetical protein